MNLLPNTDHPNSLFAWDSFALLLISITFFY
jgi:hypothetical protein